MKPVNFDSGTCNPISSNCVIWQGPNIDCINLCNGDTVSDVVYKLATELCTIMDTLNVSNYDLSCFNITACGPNDFTALIQFLIAKICELENVTPTPEKSGGGCPTDCIVTVADCFQSSGLTMNLVDYVNMIATKLCTLSNEITEVIKPTLADHETRLDVIETTYCKDCDFTIPSTLVDCATLENAGVVTGEVQTVLSNFLNDVWCSLFDVLVASGSGNDLTTLTGALNPTSCTLSSINTALSLTLTSATSLPDALNNIWEILCALKDPVTLTAQNTATIRTTVTGGPSYTISSKINDTGWIALEGFDYMSSNTDKPMCRRIGNEVNFRGYITVPMGDAGDGERGTVIDAPNPQSYVGESKGKTLNTIDSLNSPNSCLLKTYGNATWASGNVAIRLEFNLGNSVIPSGILAPGEVLDKSYTKGTRDIIFRTVETSGGLTAALHTLIGLTIIDTGVLSLSTILNEETYSGAANGIEYSGIARNVVSNIVSGGKVPTFTETSPSQYNAPGAGVYNADLTGSADTWTFDQNAGHADELGGFQVRLDGLKTYINPCDAELVSYATCS